MIYESLHDYFVKNYDKELDEKLIIPKSFIAGLLGSGLSNCFDVLAIRKQADSSVKFRDIIKEEWFKIFTRGLSSRLVYYSLHSTVLFSVIDWVGRVFNVNLHD